MRNFFLLGKMNRSLRERNTQEDAELIVSSTSSTDDLGGIQMDEDLEEIARDEFRKWLAEYGAKFFSIETAKFNAMESRRRNTRSIR